MSNKDKYSLAKAFNRRKIKCSHDRPCCVQCRSHGRSCTYPDVACIPGPKIRRKLRGESMKRDRFKSQILISQLDNQWDLQRLYHVNISRPRDAIRGVFPHSFTPFENSASSLMPSLASWARKEITLASILHPLHEPLSKESGILRKAPVTSGRGFIHLVPLWQQEKLLELYSQYVRPLVSIFHEPTFYQTHLGCRYENMHLYAMFCLAFRYLPDDLQMLSATHYGVTAESYWLAALDLIEPELDSPTLQVLQAFVLITFYELTKEITARQYYNVGLCVRIAYDLELNVVDVGDWCSNQSMWIRHEERRRLWWVIWEMETFIGNVYQRPVFASNAGIHTLLPASEESWFENRPERSVHFHPDPLHRWRLLKEGNKSDPRSFFLVAVSMMAYTAQLGSKPTYYDEVGPIDLALMSLEKALPPEIVYDDTFTFSHDTLYHDVICANIFITIQCTVRLLYRKAWSEGVTRDQLRETINLGESTKLINGIRGTAWVKTIEASDKIAVLFEQSPSAVPRLLGPYMATSVFSAACSQVVAKVFSESSEKNRLASYRLQFCHSILEAIENWSGTDKSLRIRLLEVEELLTWWREQSPPPNSQ